MRFSRFERGGKSSLRAGQTWKISSGNFNSLYFDQTEVLEAARNQADIDNHIGYDVSVSLIYRPLMSQNIVIRASYAQLIAGDGFDDLFPDEDAGYFLLNLVLAY